MTMEAELLEALRILGVERCDDDDPPTWLSICDPEPRDFDTVKDAAKHQASLGNAPERAVGDRDDERSALDENTALLARQLKAARADKGWTLRHAAGQTGISNGYLSLIETGKVKSPAPRYLKALADAYALDFAALMALAGHPASSPPEARARMSERETNGLVGLKMRDGESTKDFAGRLVAALEDAHQPAPDADVQADKRGPITLSEARAIALDNLHHAEQVRSDADADVMSDAEKAEVDASTRVLAIAASLGWRETERRLSSFTAPSADVPESSAWACLAGLDEILAGPLDAMDRSIARTYVTALRRSLARVTPSPVPSADVAAVRRMADDLRWGVGPDGTALQQSEILRRVADRLEHSSSTLGAVSAVRVGG
jgi:transcriptional regulator with XRE-family HTH domain